MRGTSRYLPQEKIALDGKLLPLRLPKKSVPTVVVEGARPTGR